MPQMAHCTPAGLYATGGMYAADGPTLYAAGGIDAADGSLQEVSLLIEPSTSSCSHPDVANCQK